MELSKLVISRAHRRLRRLEHYHSLMNVTAEELPTYLSTIPLAPDEQLVGIYSNLPQDQEEAIIISTKGLHLFRGGERTTISYQQMADVNPPLDDDGRLLVEKIYVNYLVLTLRNGSKVSLPVRGRRGKFRDAWPFLHFLMRVLDDVADNQAPNSIATIG